MKVIVVSAHPDDMEIGCSGTLKKLQDEHGAEIISIVTVQPSVEVNVNRSLETVMAETKASYDISKFQLRILNTPLHDNGRPNLTVDNNTITELSHIMESCDVCILPDPQDYHQDHRNTYHIAYPVAVKHSKEIWTMTQWPYCQYHKQNTFNLVHDIEQQWEFKKSLLSCYGSYINDIGINAIHTSNKWFGLRKNTLAEAFTVVHKNA